jgi:RNA polymerase sigma factor (sigma-70 family)
MREDAERLLEAYLSATAEEDADRQLERILEDVAKPVVRRIVSSVCRGSPAMSEAEDLVSDTLTELLRRLRDLREDPSHPIHDLGGYIVTCAYNRCHERLRSRNPARNRLRNQLQYLCNHDARLALWRTSQGVMACGFREWNGQEPASEDRADRVSLAARSDPTAEDRAQIASLVFNVFHSVGAPLSLETLAGTIARLIDLEPQRVEVPLESLTLTHTPADTELELRTTLRELWEDVRQLAPKQRAALLLNLRDVHGTECLSLLPLTRTATIDEIADIVGIARERFTALWNELPLTDVAIGELLDASPRQVIKLRRLARERLRRIEKNRQHRNLRTELDSSPAGLPLAASRRKLR